ncbi:MAG TPA: NUDIX domain-containing protein [Verrucomicrobiae bacterium]|nr:NUDIX domain-containing protein [Verrucomicrobiae bacterium]
MLNIRNSAKAIIICEDRLLLIRNKDADGDWFSLPGGGQHHGETLHDALRRECLEEIGVHVDVGELRLVREYIGKHHEFAAHDGDVHQVEFMFECRIDPSVTPVTGQTPDTQQTGIAWISLGQLPDCNVFPRAIREVLKNGLFVAAPHYLGDVN